MNSPKSSPNQDASQDEFLSADEIYEIMESPESFHRYLPDLKTAAEQGNVEVQMILGSVFSMGPEEPDEEEARKWLTLAAQNNVKEAVEALRHLSQLVRLTKAWKETENRTISEMLKEAKAGDAHAQYLLAYVYENGTKGKPNLKNAWKWYKKAADQQYIPAILALAVGLEAGRLVFEEEDSYSLLLKASWYYEDAAKLGNKEAAFNEGRLLINSPFEDEVEEGSEILLNLAEEGFVHAAIFYGVYCVQYGEPEEVEKAIELMRKLVPDYELLGKETLAECLLRRERKEDVKEAFELLKVLFEKGEPFSSYPLGRIYELGGPTKPDYEKAFQCYEVAANAGIAEGMEAYGNFLLQGKGCRKNLKKAKEWLEKAQRLRPEEQEEEMDDYAS